MENELVQTIFQRYEIKYLLNEEQARELRKRIDTHMIPDLYPHSTVRNLYYDTGSFRLARRSIEKPVYKEKLRVRCYRNIGPEDPVFVELKKKYQSVVYKRRLVLPEKEAMQWLAGGETGDMSQIAGEIEYFRDFYQSLEPKVYLSYDRDAFRDPVRNDFRLTLDTNVLGRECCLSLTKRIGGSYVLDPGLTLMEVKTAGGIPLWLTHFLNEQEIRPTSFSKYGSYYQNMIFPLYQMPERMMQYA